MCWSKVAHASGGGCSGDHSCLKHPEHWSKVGHKSGCGCSGDHVCFKNLEPEQCFGEKPRARASCLLKTSSQSIILLLKKWLWLQWVSFLLQKTRARPQSHPDASPKPPKSIQSHPEASTKHPRSLSEDFQIHPEASTKLLEAYQKTPRCIEIIKKHRGFSLKLKRGGLRTSKRF